MDTADHLENLGVVLQRLEDAGLRLKREKCVFLQDNVEYLGHRVNAHGLQPVERKVKAIVEAPSPSNVSELKAYLGLLNYYGKFLPNLATCLAPLYELLKKGKCWEWLTEQEEVFQHSKKLLQSANVLVHYSADKELVLACDASPYGLGAVLSHRLEDGSERPISFMSRTLSGAEKRYSQLDKEGLAVVFGIQKFHKYLYGRSFTICTDHKPLISLFNEKKPIPQMGSPRVQRWAVLLSAYDYTMVFRPGKANVCADALSRLPVKDEATEEKSSEQVLMLDVLGDAPVDAFQIRRWTSRDVMMSRVREYILSGWPKVLDPEFQPFHQRRTELSVRDGCVLWGARVVVPVQGREMLLKLLHQTHTGMSKMKGLARSYFWWPNMDKDVEREAQLCEVCQQYGKAPAMAPLHPWEWPTTPWSRIHVDYAGPFQGKMFLVVVDSHSKWMDVYPTTTATSQTTIEKLHS